MIAIQCKYSCGLCGVHRVIVTVPARRDEEIADWLDKVAIPRLIADHERRSPGCMPKEFSEVMIPIEGAEKIGGPVHAVAPVTQ